MMTQLRGQMKTILWILIVAFLGTIIFSWGMGGFKNPDKPGVIGEIEGQEITLENFEQIIRFEHNRAARQADNQELDDQTLKKIREDAWDSELKRILKKNEERRLHIKVTNQEIAYLVENYPPSEIREVESFQKDGKFDLELYQNFLRDPQAVPFLLEIEGRVRDFLLDQKLNFHVYQSTDVSFQDIKDEYLKGSANGKMRFIVVLNDGFEVDSSEVTEEMMRRYYHLFADKFKKYPQSRFAYVKFQTIPTSEDTADIEHEANELFKDIQNGADFAQMAEMYSEDNGTRTNGGDLDWFGYESMVPEFSEAAFTAEPGDLVGPVKTRYGFHIIKVEDHRTGEEGDEVKARHILLKMKPSAETRDQTYSDAYNFSQDILEKGFDTVTEAFDYDIDTTERFSEAGYIKGLTRMKMAANFCFNNEVGALSGVYPVPDGYIVLKVIEVTEESIKPFDEVRGTMHKSIKKILLKNKVWDRAADLSTRIETPEDLELVAAEEGLTVYVSEDSLKPTDKLPGDLKRDSDFLKEIFRLEEGEISDVIQTKRGCYIAYVERKSLWNQEDYLVHHSIIYQDLVTKQQEQVLKNWERELRIAADIKDYRYKYFRDF